MQVRMRRIVILLTAVLMLIVGVWAYLDDSDALGPRPNPSAPLAGQVDAAGRSEKPFGDNRGSRVLTRERAGVKGAIRIIGESGEPLEGVHAFIVRGQPRLLAVHSAEALSDPDGSLMLPRGLLEGESLHLVHADYIPRTFEALPEPGSAVMLQRGANLFARSIDINSGEPVRNLWVGISRRAMTVDDRRDIHLEECLPGIGESAIYRGVSDPDGSIVIRGLPHGSYSAELFHADKIVVECAGIDDQGSMTIPSVPVEIKCGSPQGIWVRFEPGKALGFSFEPPRNAWRSLLARRNLLQFTQGRDIESRTTGPSNCFRLTYPPPEGAFPDLLLLALLSDGRVETYELRWQDISSLKPSIIHVEGRSKSVGVLRCKVVDRHGLSTPARVVVRSTSGVIRPPREAVGVPLAWGQAGWTDEQEFELIEGNYSVAIIADIPAARIKPKHVKVVGGTSQEVELRIDASLVPVMLHSEVPARWANTRSSAILRSKEGEYRTAVNHDLGSKQKLLVPAGEYQVAIAVPSWKKEPLVQKTMRITRPDTGVWHQITLELGEQ